MQSVQKSNKNTLKDALAMIFIDFGSLHVAHIAEYLTYLLKSTDLIQIW